MAKAKKSFEDLDSELAALEAELAQLEGKPKKVTKPKAQPPVTAPVAPRDIAPEPTVAPPPVEEAPKKRGFKLPLKKKEKPAPLPAAPEPRGPAAPSASSSPAPARAPAPAPDATLWRREGDAWVRTAPGRAPIVRRILDEHGNVVREEPATARDLDAKSDVRAERGAGKLLGRFRK